MFRNKDALAYILRKDVMWKVFKLVPRLVQTRLFDETRRDIRSRMEIERQ